MLFKFFMNKTITQHKTYVSPFSGTKSFKRKVQITQIWPLYYFKNEFWQRGWHTYGPVCRMHGVIWLAVEEVQSRLSLTLTEKIKNYHKDRTHVDIVSVQHLITMPTVIMCNCDLLYSSALRKYFRVRVWFRVRFKVRFRIGFWVRVRFRIRVKVWVRFNIRFRVEDLCLIPAYI